MGSLTETTTGAVKAVLEFFGIIDIPPKIPLQRYLDQAYMKVKTDPGDRLGPDLGLKTHVPISIFLKSKGAGHEYAGVSDNEECFSGSLPKAAAMFAAFKLRAEARSLVNEVKSGAVISPNPADFFLKLQARLRLTDAVPNISSAAGLKTREPVFSDILRVGDFASPSTLTADFTDDFRRHMRQMIIPSNNCSAGECIFRLSYRYINVALMQESLFDKVTMKGIWLCGDYILTSPPHPSADACPNQAKSQPYIRIDTVNDCDEDTHFCGSAQNTTAKQMARLFFKILLGEWVDSSSSAEMRASSGEMRDLLREAEHGTPTGVPPPVWPSAPDPSFVGRATIPLLFDIEGVKIGQGPIKKDTARGRIQVRSEGLIIKWKITSPEIQKNLDKRNLTGDGVVCWQNLPNTVSENGIAEIINTAIRNYINQSPLTP